MLSWQPGGRKKFPFPVYIIRSILFFNDFFIMCFNKIHKSLVAKCIIALQMKKQFAQNWYLFPVRIVSSIINTICSR